MTAKREGEDSGWRGRSGKIEGKILGVEDAEGRREEDGGGKGRRSGKMEGKMRGEDAEGKGKM